MKSRLLWPLIMLALLIVINVLKTPTFLTIELKDGHLFGSLIDILNRAAPLILISIGMTVVIATKGIDLSVGSIVAISGAMACLIVSHHQSGDSSAMTLLMVIAVAAGISLAAGAWNGLLVSTIGIQPIVATLILMVAGRGLAQLITGGQIITVSFKPFSFIGVGYLAGLPFSIFIVAAFLGIASLLTRRTALGLFIESVGSNPSASRLSGIYARSVIWMVYIFCGLCAGVAGLILSSNVSSADGNNAGLWYELDAVLAVVIGGTSLSGGRFHLMGTLVGALIIQTLTTTIYSIGVPPEITLVVKAIVVLIVCLMQSEPFRRKAAGLWQRKRKPHTKKGVTV
jgi:ribose/xylose/arabinose/galactoside ABC-type transport system permease subunit